MSDVETTRSSRARQTAGRRRPGATILVVAALLVAGLAGQARSLAGDDAETVTGGIEVSDARAEERACNHHDDGRDGDEPATDNVCVTEGDGDAEGDVRTATLFQCRGADPDDPVDPTSHADVTMYSNKTFTYSDLQAGVMEATGSFLLPVDLGGEDGDAVEQVWFGIGRTVTSKGCRGPFPAPGAYEELYRGDVDGSDGWEIPVDTLREETGPRVPDGSYGFVLRALDEDAEAVVTAYGRLEVDNHRVGSDHGHDGLTRDTTPPYGMVYTAPRSDATAWNGDKTGLPACESGLAVEYGEDLAHWEVSGASGYEFNRLTGRSTRSRPCRRSGGIGGPGSASRSRSAG